MNQEVFFGDGEVARIARVVQELRARRLLIVRGRQSYGASGAERALAPTLAAGSSEVWTGFPENPRFTDVCAGLTAVNPSRFDAVIAVGGGSVIDMAKLLIALAHAPDPLAAVEGRAALAPDKRPLIAVPTTAGSGSEATHFAVVYVEGTKHAVAHPALRPARVIIDPELTYSLSPRLTALSGIDAFCQAMESMWSVHSTEHSREWAARAIALVLEHLPTATRNPTREARRSMSNAAFLAGRAIDVTRTTAAHALAYPLTAQYGVPHGQAVCLTLAALLAFNAGTTAGNVMDPRGVAHVQATTADVVRLLGATSVRDAHARVRTFIESVGLAASVDGLPIPKQDAVDAAVRGVNLERLLNNPRRMNEDDLRALFAE